MIANLYRQILVTLSITALTIFTLVLFPVEISKDMEQFQSIVQSQEAMVATTENVTARKVAVPTVVDRAQQLPSRGAGREMTIQATAYTHTGFKTYTETWPREGRTIAVDPATIPIGSRVYIKELGRWYIAEDKIPPQSVNKGAKIDIYMKHENDCWDWGRRDVRVVVMEQ